MNRNFYYLMQGGVVTDNDLIKAFEITTGNRYEESVQSYTKWHEWITSTFVYKIENPDDSTVKDFVNNGHTVMAVILYRELHKCTLAEAKEYIDSLKEDEFIIDVI